MSCTCIDIYYERGFKYAKKINKINMNYNKFI